MNATGVEPGACTFRRSRYSLKNDPNRTQGEWHESARMVVLFDPPIRKFAADHGAEYLDVLRMVALHEFGHSYGASDHIEPPHLMSSGHGMVNDCVSDADLKLVCSVARCEHWSASCLLDAVADSSDN